LLPIDQLYNSVFVGSDESSLPCESDYRGHKVLPSRPAYTLDVVKKVVPLPSAPGVGALILRNAK